MKIIIVSAFMFVCAAANAQLADASVYSTYIDTGDLKKHLYTIASADMEGRETATPGQKMAAAYIETHFRNLGLLPGWNGAYQQTFPVYRDSLVKSSLTIDGVELKHDSDFVERRDEGIDTSLSVQEVLFAGYGLSDSTRNDYEQIDATGKVVLVYPGSPLTKIRGKQRPGLIPSLTTLQEAAAKNHAAALLIVDVRFPRQAMPVVGPMYVGQPEQGNEPVTFYISESVARTLLGNPLADSLKTIRNTAPAPRIIQKNVSLELRRSRQELQSSNVIGILEGTSKKDEAIVITAHYDHIGKRGDIINFGADDDGSGTVTILELSEAFSKAAANGNRPLRSIVFMTVSGEEKGLWGSEYYAEHPVFPMEKTSVNVNIDMIGRVEASKRKDSLNYVYVVGDNRLSSDLRPISESVNNKQFKMTLDYKFNDPDDPQRIYYRSDHYNFAKHGVPAVFYFNGLHEDYHRSGDTPDKIKYQLLAKRAQLIFYTAWEFANKPEMLKRDLP